MKITPHTPYKVQKDRFLQKLPATKVPPKVALITANRMGKKLLRSISLRSTYVTKKHNIKN